MDYWAVGQAYYFGDKFTEADSAFAKVIEKQNGKAPLAVYLFAARAKANIDSTMETGIAKPSYDMYLEKALVDPEKNKKGIIEAYEYLGAYYIHKEENVNQAKTYYEKILAIDPKHEEATKFIKTINTPAQKGTGGTKGGK
jgi:tetratricopeptide (TPR) repeat protein